MAFINYIDPISLRDTIIFYYDTEAIISDLENKTSYHYQMLPDAKAEHLFSKDFQDWLLITLPGVMGAAMERTNRLTFAIAGGEAMFINSTRHTTNPATGIIINDYGRHNKNLVNVVDKILKEYILNGLLKAWYTRCQVEVLVKDYTLLSIVSLASFGRLLSEFYLRKKNEMIFDDFTTTLSWIDPVCVLVDETPVIYDYDLYWTDPVCVLVDNEDYTYTLKWTTPACVIVDKEETEYTYSLKWTTPVCVIKELEFSFALAWTDPVCVLIDELNN